MLRVLATVPIVEVTLLEDRAHLRRRGAVELPAGLVTLAVDGVSPALVDKSATCVAKGPGGVRVADVRVERRKLERLADRPAAARAREQELSRVRRERDRAGVEIVRLQEELELVGQLRAMFFGEIGEDAVWAAATPERWQADLAALDEREDRLDASVAARKAEMEELSWELADLTRRRDLEDPEKAVPMAATVVAELVVESAGPHDVEIGYVVPGACWRPQHTARLVEGPRVEITCEAAVWQRTGEDWNDVALVCSTERPSLGVEPPRLESDLLRLRRKEEAVFVETREQIVESTGGAPARSTAELPGIDDGGEPQLLRASAPARVPSDGQPHRVPLFTFTAPAEIDLVLAAELAPAVIRRSRQANLSPKPLLAGPVDLVRRGGPAGRTSILFVPPGAEFELGWGPEGDLRVARSVDETDEKSSLLSGWRTRRHLVEVAISNLGPSPHTIAMRERIPVSEIEKVQVELESKVEPPARPDDDGFLRWSLTVPGRRQERVRFAYKVKMGQDVVAS